MRRMFFADDLLDVVMPGNVVVTWPCERRADGRVLVFAFPQIPTGTWLVNDALASTLPVSCPSQGAAQRLADVWIDAVTHESVDPTNAEQVSNWCWWWASTHPDRGVFTPVPELPRVHQANTVQETPAADRNEMPAVTGRLPSINDIPARPAPVEEESA